MTTCRKIFTFSWPLYRRFVFEYFPKHIVWRLETLFTQAKPTVSPAVLLWTWIAPKQQTSLLLLLAVDILLMLFMLKSDGADLIRVNWLGRRLSLVLCAASRPSTANNPLTRPILAFSGHHSIWTISSFPAMLTLITATFRNYPFTHSSDESIRWERLS